MSDPLPRAEQLFRWGRFDEARRVLLDALARDPERPPALRLLALVHLRLGEEEAADAAARRAIRLAPDESASHHVHALVLLHRGRSDEATRRLAEALRLAPSDADLHALEATMRAAWEEWPAAEAAAARALALEPSHPQAVEARATALLVRGRVGDAERIVRDALAQHPDDANLLRRLGQVLERRNRPDEAAAAFGAAARLDPSDLDSADGSIRALRRGDARTGRLHAALLRLESWRAAHGTALLLLAPFVAYGLSRVGRGETRGPPLLPPSVVEWGLLAALLLLWVAGAASTVLWARAPGRGPAVPRGAARRALRRLAAVAGALVTALLLSGAGPARTLPGLLWLLAADGEDAAAARPPGPARRRLTTTSRAVATLAVAGLGYGLVAPPLPVAAGVAGFVGAWAALAALRRTTS